jgi:preprotein translocase SecE subunit
MINKLKKIPKFLKETNEEFKKITWTKKEDLFQSAIVVVVLLVFFTTYIFIIDLGLSKLIRIFFG